MIEMERFKVPPSPPSPWIGLGGGLPLLLGAGLLGLLGLGRGRSRIDMSGWGEFLWIPPRGVAEFSAVEFFDEEDD